MGHPLSFHPQSTYFPRDETGSVCLPQCPLSWSVHCNFTGEGKCNERGWACTPHPHQPGLIYPHHWMYASKQRLELCVLCASTILLLILVAFNRRGKVHHWGRIHGRTISLRFLGIILRVLRLMFPYTMFTLQTSFKLLLLKGGGGE